MIEIGGKPILWHIMKTYSHHGINDFVVCCGYKGYVIKEFFANYFLHSSDVTFDLRQNKLEVHQQNAEPWRVTLVDTGESTMTGGRLRRIAAFIENDDAFCLTYGDGVSDVNITELIRFHRAHGLSATLTAAFPPGRFGVVETAQDMRVTLFREKPAGEGGRINGGFFVLSPKVIALIENDLISWEQEPLERLAQSGQLMAFPHNGFWQPMDTLRDKRMLEDLWSSGRAPWKVWA